MRPFFVLVSRLRFLKIFWFESGCVELEKQATGVREINIVLRTEDDQQDIQYCEKEEQGSSDKRYRRFLAAWCLSEEGPAEYKIVQNESRMDP